MNNTGKDQINTSNCPQKALKLVANVFDDGVHKFGDANTHRGNPYSNIGKAQLHLEHIENAEGLWPELEIEHIKKAICRLMLALNVLCDKESNNE